MKVVRKKAGMVGEESHAIEKARRVIDTVVEVKILSFERFFEGFEGIPQFNLQVIFVGMLNEGRFGTFGALVSKFIFLFGERLRFFFYRKLHVQAWIHIFLWSNR